MNLHKTLKAYNEASVQPEQEMILAEALAIIKKSEQSELDVLSKLGMDKNLKKFEVIAKESQQASKFDEIYDISVIKKMAVHYGLRFLPSNLYVGTIDPELPSVLNRFISKNGIEIKAPEMHRASDFYILAPASSFELQIAPKDPIMFYRINESKYAFIHKWGKDLSIWRKIRNWPVRNSGNFSFSYFLIVSLIINSIYLLNHEPRIYIAYASLFFIAVFLKDSGFNVNTWRSENL